MQPTNHHLTVTDRNGKQIHGKVVFVHYFGVRSAEVHIVTNDWLDPYRYPARYSTPHARRMTRRSAGTDQNALRVQLPS